MQVGKAGTGSPRAARSGKGRVGTDWGGLNSRVVQARGSHRFFWSTFNTCFWSRYSLTASTS